MAWGKGYFSYSDKTCFVKCFYAMLNQIKSARRMSLIYTGKNSMTNSRKLVELYNETGMRLLERFYDTLKTGELIDPVRLPSSDVYYIWVYLRENMPGGDDLKLGDVARALHLEGHLDPRTGMLRGTSEDDEPPGATDGLAAPVPVSAELDADP